MSDEEGFLDEGVTGEEEQPAGVRTGFLPAVVITILKWAAIGLGAIIFVVTIVLITNKLLGEGKEISGIPAYSVERQREAIDTEYFNTGLDSIRGSTSDVPSRSFLASITIGYPEGKTVIQTELVSKKELIQNTILKYLGKKKAIDLQTKNFGNLENELRTKINNGIMKTGQILSVLIQELQTF